MENPESDSGRGVAEPLTGQGLRCEFNILNIQKNELMRKF